ncbi:carboxypeptidase regulatory-like domain-containing protein [Gimesia aquarii]|uniref:Nickel uptake substrate-specific transmembrane region n=1 Tax=Gimesia aquarii TaxID=2527964 RepID=A0A517VSN3_9PLAN|nr:carboxypeptidase regulatory-like domain-containing protein [Gimesia aquarii]QDT96021.1 hypothetical protein V144x_14740 [Gimesia aquarii]
MKSKLLVPFLSVVLILSSGCGSQSGDMPEIAIVKGWVKLDGEPVKSASVIFQPEKGRPSVGHTDYDGNFELKYIADKKGAVLGNHKVSISTYKVEEIVESDERHEVPERIPEEYNTRTNLTASVEPGINEINFELNSSRK